MAQREADNTAKAPSAMPAPPASNRPTGDGGQGVIVAFVLGWHVAELFHAPVPRSVPRRPSSADKLAGISELDALARAKLLLTQVQTDLHRIWRSEDPGQLPPDTAPVQSLLVAESRRRDQLQHAVSELHRQLLVSLTAADFRLGKAYGLGRALAETSLLPRATDPQSFRRAFDRYRLATIVGWLADLKSLFQPHAAQAVRGSLEAWAAWAQFPTLHPAVDDGRQQAAVDLSHPAPKPPRPGLPPAAAAPAHRIRFPWRLASQPQQAHGRPVDWESGRDRESVTRALHRQAQIWRAVLSGEKNCRDLLSADDYLWAADRLLGHLRQLTGRFLRRYWLATTIVVVVLAAVIAAVFAVPATTTVLGVLAVGAGAVGITWRGVASSLGRVVAQAQGPLWAAELDAAIAMAATRLPHSPRPAEPPTVPVDSGQEPEVSTIETAAAGAEEGRHARG